MGFKHIYTRYGSSHWHYSTLQPMKMNWFENDHRTGIYWSADHLQMQVNDLGPTDSLNFDYSSPFYLSEIRSKYRYFKYEAKKNGSTVIPYWTILTGVIKYINYDSPSEEYVDNIDAKYKCCEINPSNIDLETGYIHVPASVGKYWNHGTKIVLTPQQIINSNQDGIVPTIFPTLGTVNLTTSSNEIIGTELMFPVINSASFSAQLLLKYISLRKISDTTFQPYLYYVPQPLMNNGYGPYNFGKDSYVSRLPFYENYRTKIFQKIITAGSNYILNVYERKNILPTGTSVFVVPALSEYNKDSYENANFDAKYNFIFQSWLDSRYVDLNENKILVSELTQPATDTQLYYNDPANMLGAFGNHPTGTAVQIYPSRLYNYWAYEWISVDYSTSENINLAGEQYIQDVFVTEGKRVLVKNQTDKKQNGTYTVKKGNWQYYNFVSTPDALPVQPYTKRGYRVEVYYEKKAYKVDAPFTLGVTEINFDRIESFYAINEPDEIKLTVLPSGLEVGKVYYLIRGSGWIKFAQSYQDALDEIAIPLQSMGKGLIAVYVASLENSFPEKVLTRDSEGNPLTTEPLDPGKPYYLINLGARFALAETKAKSLTGEAIPVYQKPNTYYALEPTSVYAQPVNSSWNKNRTSFAWKPDKNGEDYCTDYSHFLPALNAAGEPMGISPSEVPSYVILNINATIPTSTRVRYSAMNNPDKVWFVYSPFNQNIYIEHYNDPNLPPATTTFNGSSDLTGEFNNINQELAESLSGNTLLHFVGTGNINTAFPSLFTLYPASYHDNHNKYLIYKGTKEVVKFSTYEFSSYYWVPIMTTAANWVAVPDLTFDPYYTCTTLQVPYTDIDGTTTYTPTTRCSCSYPNQKFEWTENGFTHFHLTQYQETTGHEVGSVYYLTTVMQGSKLELYYAIDTTNGRSYLSYRLSSLFSATWPVNNGDPTNYTINGLNYAYTSVSENIADSRYDSYSVNANYYALPNSNVLTKANGPNEAPATISVVGGRKFISNNSVELHFEKPVYHIWKKVGPVNYGNTTNNSKYLTKADWDADLSNFQQDIICQYDPSSEKYKSDSYESNGITFKVEVVPSRDLSGALVYGAPNSYVYMYKNFEYYSKNTQSEIQSYYTDYNPTPFLANPTTRTTYVNFVPITTLTPNGADFPILDPNMQPESTNIYNGQFYRYITDWQYGYLGVSRYVAPLPYRTHNELMPYESSPVSLIHLMYLSV